MALSVGLLVFPPDSTIYRVLFLVGYPLVLSFQLTLSWILWGFIFKAKRVGSDVLLAAVALYLLLGGIFVPIFGFVETWEWMFNGRHAFVDGLRDIPPDEIFPWQTISYYSYATLTTLGYGDVLPATTTARSIASFEAVVGVLGWWGCMRRMRLLGRSRKRGAGSREHEVGG